MSKKKFSVPVQLLFNGEVEILASNQKEAMQIARKRCNGLLDPQIDTQFNDVLDYDFSSKVDEVRTDKINTKEI